jgi:hypothetical protein
MIQSKTLEDQIEVNRSRPKPATSKKKLCGLDHKQDQSKANDVKKFVCQIDAKLTEFEHSRRSTLTAFTSTNTASLTASTLQIIL